MIAQFLTLLPVIFACTAALVAGGVVKGVVSIGLPLVGLPLLTFAVDVPTAVNLLVVPIFLSNLLQAFQGPRLAIVLQRFWPVILCLVVGTLVGTALFALLDQRTLLGTIGAFSVVFSLASLLRPDLTISPRIERWLGPPVGLLGGVIGGMSTLFGPVLAVYVVALHLPPALFVKSISLLYTVAAFVLMLGNLAHGSTHAGGLILSALAMIPVYAGMLVGQRIRDRIDADRFRILVLGVVFCTGANMIRVGLGY